MPFANTSPHLHCEICRRVIFVQRDFKGGLADDDALIISIAEQCDGRTEYKSLHVVCAGECDRQFRRTYQPVAVAEWVPFDLDDLKAPVIIDEWHRLSDLVLPPYFNGWVKLWATRKEDAAHCHIADGHLTLLRTILRLFKPHTFAAMTDSERKRANLLL